MHDTPAQLIDKVKLAIPLATDAYDADLEDLLDAAQLDLEKTAGVVLPDPLDALVERAIITYVKMHFISMTDSEYARMKAAYDEQKAQLMMATGYTDWGGIDADA